jgi:DNA-binding NtrC family response regulator
MKPTLLIVDDEPDMLRLLQRSIGQEMDCRVITAGSGAEALERFAEGRVDLSLLDIRMPGMDGMELLERLRAQDPQLTIVMMTAYGAIEVAVEAIRKGAYDFITKPFDHDELVHRLTKALERGRLLRENLDLKQRVRGGDVFQDFIGASPPMRRIYDTIEMLCQTDVTVLITGESGTGKNLAARAIHDLGPRKGAPFVRVSCPTVPENILESELFGYAKGAFTHATADRKGLVEEAHGGTLFLDEIGDISPAIQTKLLQVLEEKEFKPLGQTRSVRVDVRVIAATNRDLKAKMDRGEFREDLFYRLCVVELPMPVLKTRPEDIPLLADHFLSRYCRQYGSARKHLAPETVDRLLSHEWKGNVRELENLMKRAAVMGSGPLVGLPDLGWDRQECLAALPPADNPGGSLYREAKQAVMQAFNRRFLSLALERSEGNVTRAAEASGLERQSFQQLMRKSGIRSEDFRGVQKNSGSASSGNL